MSMIKNAVALGVTACMLGGCLVAPYNQSPAELKADPQKFREQVSFSMPLEEFLRAAYMTQTSCGDSLTFAVSPDRTFAFATSAIPGLSSMATVAFAEAKEEQGKTVVKVWAQNNGFAFSFLKALRQIGSPPKCA